MITYERGAEAQGDRDPAGLEAKAGPNHDLGENQSRYRLRLSMRAKLALGVLVAALPVSALALWLAWESPYLGIAGLACLFSLALGLSLTAWANQPLSELAERARRLAGMSTDRRRLLGLIRTDPPGDEAISTAMDRIQQSFHEIRALNRIGQLVATEEDLGLILSAIVEEAVELLQTDAGLIGSWDADHEVFRDVAAYNLPIMFPGREFGARESLSSQVAKSGRVIFVEDYQQYPFRISELEDFKLRAGLGVPLMVGDECKGALVVHSIDPDRRYTVREGELLMTFANQAGTAFEKARLYQLALDQLAELRATREDLALEGQELERALSNLVRMQEEERSRIAADVHDGVVQMMVGSLCELQAAMAHFPQDLDRVAAKQEKARNLIRDSITELRRVIFDLRPITLDTAGLVPAVQSLLEDLQGISDERLELYAVGTPCRFWPETEIGLYRIIQEALNNALQHSGASSIEITVRFAEEMMYVEVRDDGNGFSVEEATELYGRQAGLIGMRERARSLEGRLSITSGPGQGTTVAASVPCRSLDQRERQAASSPPSCVDLPAAEAAPVGEDGSLS